MNIGNVAGILIGILVNGKFKPKFGKIAFADNTHKTNSISYADGSSMNTVTKFKVVNYFAKWLSDNNLISNEVTVTFE